MGYLPAEVIRDCSAQLERANIPMGEAVAGLRSRAPGLAVGLEGNFWPIIFNTLNDHPDPILLCEWLEDQVASLRLRAWPEGDLECLIHAVSRARQSAPWSTLSEAEVLYQGALESELRRAKAELRGLNDPRRSVTAVVDRERVSARLEHLKREQQRGRPPQSGDVLGERYELEELIGRGGFSTVWLALDRPNDDHVAVKILRGELRNDENARERFFAGGARMQREAARNLGVVRVIEPSCHEGPYHYFVMEYVVGGTLDQLVAQNLPGTRAEAEGVLLAICDVVAQLHANGCLHLDIKPSNILLGDRKRPKLTDFEHVHRVQDVAATHQGRPHVSPHYSAPELVAGGAARRESDVFSLARVALSIQLGRALDSSVEASDFLDSQPISIALATVLRKATQRTAELRYSDAGTLRAALVEAFADSRDFDRWIEKVAIPGVIVLSGGKAVRAIAELLLSLRDIEQLRRLLVYLGYDPLIVSEDATLIGAATDIAVEIDQWGDVLKFWRGIERYRRAAKSAPSDGSCPPPLLSRLKSLILGEVWQDSLEPLRFFAMVALSDRGVVSLPQASSVPPLDYVAQTLATLERGGCLSRFASLLVTARPELADRLPDEQVRSLAEQEIPECLWSIWRSIPAVDPSTYLRGRLPPHAHGFLAPRWSDARTRFAGAIALYRNRLTGHPAPFLPLPANSGQALALLLAFMFEDVELRNLAAYLGNGIAAHLCSHRASILALADSLVIALTRESLLPFFALLRQRRPRWEAELLDTAEKFGLSMEAYNAARPPRPTTSWCLGEQLLTITANEQVKIEQIGVPIEEVSGDMTAPRVRMHVVADWLFRRGLVDSMLILRLRALAPQHERAISEFTADSALETPWMGLCPLI